MPCISSLIASVLKVDIHCVENGLTESRPVHAMDENQRTPSQTPSATLPLSLDIGDLDVVSAFPNPTGRTLLEKLALAAQEAEPSPPKWDQAGHSDDVDDIPSSPIY